MSIGDKARNEAKKLAGKAKEAAGRAAGDDSLENQGKRDQRKAQVKKAGESVKKVFKR